MDKYHLALRASEANLKSLKEFSLTWLKFFVEFLKKHKDNIAILGAGEVEKTEMRPLGNNHEPEKIICFRTHPN